MQQPSNWRARFAILGALCIPAFHICGQQTFQKSINLDNKRLVTQDVIASSDAYIAAGHTLSYPLTDYRYRPFLAKIDAGGAVQWFRQYLIPNQSVTTFNKVIEANDGGYLAVGHRNGDDIDSQLLLVKTDSSGALQWTKTLHSVTPIHHNLGYWVCAVSDGYIISGLTDQNGVRVPVLIRTDNAGQTVWSRRYPDHAGEHAWFIAALVQGDTIFASGAKDSLALYAMIDATDGKPLLSRFFDGAGIYQSLPGSFDKSLLFMAPAPDGDLLLSGHATVAGPNATTLNNLWICRISRNGELRWSKRYSLSSSILAGRINPLPDGGFIITSPYAQSNQVDPQLLKINGDGEIEWAYRYGEAGLDQFSGAIGLPDGGVLAVGAVFPPDNIGKLLLVKTDAAGLVAGCCAQPLAMQAIPFPATVFQADINPLSFDPTGDIAALSESMSLSSLDYCPPVTHTAAVPVPLCPGDSIVIDGVTYTGPATVSSLVSGPGCDTNFVYSIQTGVNPTLERSIFFCPGDTVSLHGNAYTEPTVFTQAVPAANGRCDTLVTYFLAYAMPAGPTSIAIDCPANIFVETPAGAPTVPVTYAAPNVQSDCPCHGFALQLTGGLPSGSAFPPGIHVICFEATDSCGNQAACCFQVGVSASDALPCDVKTNGCVTFELLGIGADAQGRKTYEVRVQNNCVQPLLYAAFQLPDGVDAYAPADKQTYAAPSGRLYTVRNPNHSPIHSIQFKAQDAGITGGESDIFRFSLPPQLAPDYINAVVKLDGPTWVESHLNTFHCPVEKNAPPPAPVHARNQASSTREASMRLYPNPAGDELTILLNSGAGQPARISLFNAQGRLILTRETAENRLTLGLDVPAGVYFIEAMDLYGGHRRISRFVVH